MVALLENLNYVCGVFFSYALGGLFDTLQNSYQKYLGNFMKKTTFLIVFNLFLLNISPFATASQWWQPDEEKLDGSGFNLDTYKVFKDRKGQEIISVEYRQPLQNVSKNKKQFLSLPVEPYASLFKVDILCQTDQLKLVEYSYLDSQFKPLWHLSQHPEFQKNFPYVYNEFYHPIDLTTKDLLAKNLINDGCSIRRLEKQKGISMKDIANQYGNITQ